jgi:hypothetical protein
MSITALFYLLFFMMAVTMSMAALFFLFFFRMAVTMTALLLLYKITCTLFEAFTSIFFIDNIYFRMVNRRVGSI